MGTKTAGFRDVLLSKIALIKGRHVGTHLILVHSWVPPTRDFSFLKLYVSKPRIPGLDVQISAEFLKSAEERAQNRKNLQKTIDGHLSPWVCPLVTAHSPKGLMRNVRASASPIAT